MAGTYGEPLPGGEPRGGAPPPGPPVPAGAGSPDPNLLNTGPGAVAVAGGVAAGAYGAAAGAGGTASVTNIVIQPAVDGYGALADLLRAPAQPRRRPASPPPRRPASFFGRANATAYLESAIRGGGAVALTGPDGAGKSTLMAAAANAAADAATVAATGASAAAAASARTDGTILVEGPRPDAAGVRDLVQQLYDAVWDTGVPKRVVDVPAARAELAGIRPLVLIDGWRLADRERQTILDLLPQSSIIYASDEPSIGGGFVPEPLGPLEREASIQLFQARCGPERAPDRATADRVAGLLADWPGAVAMLGDLIRGGRIELDAALTALAAPVDGMAAATLAAADPASATSGPTAGSTAGETSPAAIAYLRLRAVLEVCLTPDEMGVLRTIAGMPGPSVAPSTVELASDVDAAPAIDSLKGAGLVWANSPRLRMDGGLRWALRSLGESSSLENLARRIGKGDPTPEDADAWLAAIGEADRRGWWETSLELIRKIDGVLLSEGRWDAWNRVLVGATAAATKLDDDAAVAWSLHQRGTLALALGDMAGASNLLGRALAIRGALGDPAAIARTAHNLSQLSGGGGAGDQGGHDGPDRPNRDGSGGVPRGRMSWRLPRLLSVLPMALLALFVAVPAIVAAGVVTGVIRPPGGPVASVAGVTSRPTATPAETQAGVPTLSVGAAFTLNQLLPTGDWTGQATVTASGGRGPYIFEPDALASTGADDRRLYPLNGKLCDSAVIRVTVRSADGQRATIDRTFQPDRCASFSQPMPPIAGQPDASTLRFNCQTRPVTLDWHPAPDSTAGTNWRVEVQAGSDESGWNPVGQPEYRAKDPVVTVAVPCQGTIRWHVASVSKAGWQGEFSDWFQFTTIPTAVPVLGKPDISTICDNPVLTWTVDPADGIRGFTVEIQDLTAGTDPTTIAATEPSTKVEVTCQHTYRWRVASIDGDGAPGAYSDPGEFTIAAPLQ